MYANSYDLILNLPLPIGLKIDSLRESFIGNKQTHKLTNKQMNKKTKK